MSTIDWKYGLTWVKRFSAFIIDSTIVLFINLPVFIIIMTVFVKKASCNFSSTISSCQEISFVGIYPLIILLSIGIYILYNVLTMGRSGDKNGQTFGKQLLKIRVANIENINDPVSVRTIIIRQSIVILVWTMALITFGISIIISYSSPFFNENNQSFHDNLSKTIILSIK